MNSTLVNKSLVPQKALIIYGDPKESYSREFFIESRDIKQVSGKYTFMAPVPLSDDTMKKLAASYTKANAIDITHEPMIAEHMLHGSNKLGRTVTAWYRPACKRTLNFSAGLHIKGDKSVFVPATLYVVIQRSLYIYALDKGVRPDGKTKLYNAPFFNIHGDGNVCLGTAQVGKAGVGTYEREAERFERAFYMAEQNGGGNRGRAKSDIVPLWNGLIKSQKPFPVKELLPHSKYKTMQDLFTKLIGKANGHD